MKNYGFLFLVIAIIHSPHEMNCVKIIHDGFEPKTKNSRYCRTWVCVTGRIILDEGETLENIPPCIILQFKCPHLANEHGLHFSGPKDGSWMLFFTVPVESCAQTGRSRYIISCSHSTGQTYRIAVALGPFYIMKNCSIRIFLGETAKIGGRYKLTNDHGLKGLTKELLLTEFIEAPYYNTTKDALCEMILKETSAASDIAASDRQPPTDVFLMICGVAMVSAVHSF